MKVCYDKLWKLLIDKKMKKYMMADCVPLELPVLFN